MLGRGSPRPPPDRHRAGGVAKQAAAGSAEGGAAKQSEAILDSVFLSSPILSFARKRKNGKKKKTLTLVYFSAQRVADAALGPVSFLCLARKILDRKNRLRCPKGFWALSPRITARIRSLWRSVGCYRTLLMKPSVRQNALFIPPVIPNRCAHR